MTYNKRKTGEAFEKKAVAYLQVHNFVIRECNFRCRFGEIDIIATDGSYLVFIEVKYRRNQNLDVALEAVTYAKQKVIRNCASLYLRRYFLEYMPCRFDVIAMNDEEIVHIKNAFD